MSELPARGGAARPPMRLLLAAGTAVAVFAVVLFALALVGGDDAADGPAAPAPGPAAVSGDTSGSAATAADALPLPRAPYFGEQWALYNFGQVVGGAVAGTPGADVRAPEAWRVTTGDAEVLVAVIDTGIAPDHPALASSLWANPGESGSGRESNGVDDDGNGYVDDWRGWNFVEDDNAPLDARGSGLDGAPGGTIAHGTAVASLIAAGGSSEESAGMTGIAPNVRVLPLRAFFQGIDGRRAADAIAYAAAAGARVINLSFGTFVPGFDAGMRPVVEAIDAHPEVLFVAAAGNSGQDNDVVAAMPCSSPAPNLICVASSDQQDMLAGDSNYGATSVDLAAPGANILVAQPALEEVWSEGFEQPLEGRWVTGGEGDRWGRSGTPRSGEFALADSPDGDYDEGTESWARMREPVDLSDREGWCQLDFHVRGDPGVSDALMLEERTDAGVFALRVGVRGFSSTSATDGEYVPVHIAVRAGRPVAFGFRMRDNPFTPAGDGFAIDDLSITCLSSSYGGREYGYAAGTSFATPLVSGAAALIWSAHPDLDVASVRRAILESVDRVPALAGLLETGGRLNAAAALERAATLAGAGSGAQGGLLEGLSLPDSPQPVPPVRPGRGQAAGDQDGPPADALPAGDPAADPDTAGGGTLASPLNLLVASLAGLTVGVAVWRVTKRGDARRGRGRDYEFVGLDLPGFVTIGPWGDLVTARERAMAEALGKAAALPGLSEAGRVEVEREREEVESGGLGGPVRALGHRMQRPRDYRSTPRREWYESDIWPLPGWWQARAEAWERGWREGRERAEFRERLREVGEEREREASRDGRPLADAITTFEPPPHPIIRYDPATGQVDIGGPGGPGGLPGGRGSAATLPPYGH